MQAIQIANIMNQVYTELTGNSGIINEDLSNVIQVGNDMFYSYSYDNYVQSLINVVGRMEFVSRKYTGGAPSVYKDSWEYGSLKERVRFVLPNAEMNPAWDLIDGNTYNQDVFKKPGIQTTFFNDMDTYLIPLSVTEEQVKESLTGLDQLNGFISGLFLAVENALQVRNDGLIMRTINNMSAKTINEGGKSYVKLLTSFNTRFSKNLTAEEAITDEDFIRYANYTINKYVGKLQKMSSLYNIAGVDTFTPGDKLHLVTLDDYDAALGSYLYDAKGQFSSENLKLPQHESVSCWQGTGDNGLFANNSKINVTLKDITPTGDPVVVEKGYIVAVLFDDMALGINNDNRKTTSHKNELGEFTNYWFKVRAQYFNDYSFNFVVFVLE